MNLDLVQSWTLDEYLRECAGLIDLKRFDAMAVGGKNQDMYYRSRFERGTALGAWKRWLAVLIR